MAFDIREYKERAPKLEAVEFTGEFELAGLIANFAQASSFEMSRSTGILLLTFEGAEPETGYQVAVSIGDMVIKSAGVVKSMPAGQFNTQYENV